jgi:hypothetical protein
MNTRTITTLLVSALAVFALALGGCAEREDPVDVEIAAHPDGWTNPGSEDFHGVYLQNITDASRDLPAEQQRTGAEGCRSCHGQDLGFQSQQQCLDCHASGNSAGHPAPNVFLAPQDDGFHGKVIADAMMTEQCQVCHGIEYDGGWSMVSCVACHAGGRSGHPSTEVMFDPDEDGYHANLLAERGPGACAECHGEQGGGSWTGVACTTCHAGNPNNAGGLSGHPAAAVWNDPTSDDFHGDAYQQLVDQGQEPCTACHGEDLLGGPFQSPEYPRLSCNACHAWPLAGR